jgi:broad specificity phosphatase PhoE
LIRHGETDWNREGKVQGFQDVELNDLGRRQAEAVASSLREEEVQAVYSSPLKRALETAHVIAEAHGLNVILDDRLKELNQGVLEGMTSERMWAEYESLLKRWREEPASLKMPGGESLQELQARCWDFIQTLVQRHSSGTVVVVGHGFGIRAILCKVIGLDLNNFRRMRQSLAARNLVEFGERGWILVSMNETLHLRSVESVE